MPHKKSNDTLSKCFQMRKSAEDLLNNMPSTPTARFCSRRMTEFQQGTPECFSAVAIDSPLLKSRNIGLSADVLNIGQRNDDDDSSITVGVRVRPFTQRELDEEDVKCIVSMRGNETVVTPEKGDPLRFTYDYSFWSFDQSSDSYADQVKVYTALAQPLLNKVFEGYNACLFAYGQTSSGKSYSVMGHGNDVGIVPRFCGELFQRIQNNSDDNVIYNVEISFFEIYNEKIHDLLGSSSGKDKSFKKPNLKVREHPVMGPFVDGLSTYVVKSFEDIETWLNVGNKRRATACTGMNDNSSRSHSVFTLILTQTKTSVIEGTSHSHNITSKINLVDLAGSERQSLAKTSGDRLKEGSSINKSLMALGKVISVLSEQQTNKNKKNQFIQYRETILTWLLKESLGGNSKTCMLATISPSNLNTEETLSTLRYAKQARSIVNNARINEDPNARIIRSLQMEIEKLRALASGNGDLVGGVLGGNGLSDGEERCLMEIKSLKEELTRKEREMVEMNKSWQEKLKQSEACKQEEARQLEKSGISLKIDRDLPSLVNLNEDPQLNEVLVYVLRRGVTRVGRLREDCSLEIQLTGALISDEQCKFEFDGRRVTLTSLGNSLTYVNGRLLDNALPVFIHNGDRIVLAGDHFFRFINLLEEVKGSSVNPIQSLQPKDFYFAYQEFSTMQNARLESELLKTRERHNEEMKLLASQTNEETTRMQQQLAQSRLQADNLLVEYQNKVTTLEKMLKEHGHDHTTALDQIRKLKFENQTLERKLEILKMTQNSIDNVEVPLKKCCPNLLTCLDDMKKNLKFCKDYMGGVNADDGQVVIKVLRTSLNISTFWSLDKFEAKLQDMRDLYMDKIDSSRSDEIFFDPRDAWESEYKLTSSPLTNQLHMRRSISLQNTKIQSPINLNFTLGFLDLSIAESSPNSPTSTANTKTLTSDRPLTTATARTNDLVTNAPASNMFSQLIDFGLKDFKVITFDDSLADRVLYLCQRVYNLTNELNNSFFEDNANFDFDTKITSVSSLVHAFNSLQTRLSDWLWKLNSSQSEIIVCSKEKLTNSIFTIGGCMQFFIQGLESSIPSLVEEYKNKILEEVLNICYHCGKFAQTCRLDCYSLKSVVALIDDDDEDGRKLSNPIKASFIRGCNEFVDDALSAAVSTVHENKCRAINVFQCVKQKLKPSTRDLMKKTYKTASSILSLLQNLKLIQTRLMASESSYSHQQQQQPLQQQQPQLQTQNMDSDLFLNAHNRCKFFSIQYSGIVDCTMQLIDMITYIIADESVIINVTSLKSLLEAMECHANNLTNNPYITSYKHMLDSAARSLNVTSLSDISMFRDRSCCLDGSLDESQIELLEAAVAEIKSAVSDFGSFVTSKGC
ncbi:hypothetical protein HELRODRAFT_192579 [Helobdella robusta]|uniref:Kinesin motor domain-containing protein n=1 Tax=Helobdella robusta TaxID=6412 RepID=T1FU32_HELRO|nr:hypothetical protein HELRODRAFT_192579 [Helobdella robusta]ESO00704.1 hypothetical protein HELRODRAFT_192579 [Helobdella robusta]